MPHESSHPSRRVQRGASMLEFVLVAPFLLFLGLGTVQLGLIYHAKTILNYATFEAARTGAVNHALPEPMRRELALRLAPLHGGDGSAAAAARAIARSVAEVEAATVSGDDGNAHALSPTRIERLSPTSAAFEDWAVDDPASGRRVIPNSHLRHRYGRGNADRAGPVGERSGLTLADANLLEIEVVHGYPLKVPLVGAVLTRALALVDDDPHHHALYAVNRLPISSVATVRMQSDVWLDESATGTAVAPDGTPEEPASAVAPGAGDGAQGEGSVDGEPFAASDDDACDEHGFRSAAAMPVSESAVQSGACAIGTGAYDPGGLPAILDPGGGAESAPESSPIC